MAEPEDVLAEGALAATRLVRQLWARRGTRSESPPQLSDLRRRLDLLLAAVFPDAPDIAVAEPPASPTLLARLARRPAPASGAPAALASTDGYRIRLPKQLESLPAEDGPLAYRLLALEQAARAARGTPAAVPLGNPLLRDLFLLSEAAAVDRLLVELLPGIAGALRDARADALARRVEPRRVSLKERAVEVLVRMLLAADPAIPPPPLGPSDTPADSFAWARNQAAGLAGLKGLYRGMTPVSLWGTTASPPDAAVATAAFGPADGGPLQPGRVRKLPRRPRARQARADEDDSTPGTWIVRADDAQEKAEDPAGLQRPADRDGDTDPGELADVLSELSEARLVRTPGSPPEVLTSDDPVNRAAGGEPHRFGDGIVYPEWDCRAGAYRPRGAVIREFAAPEAGDEWAERALRRHAALLQGVRRDFERLRPRRVALRCQPDGSELDVDAYVAAYADVCGGGAVNDRLYIDARPLRRDLAVTLLADASASTDGWVGGDRRIIDVEKEALLIVCAAMAALGDRYSVLAFSGEGPERVEIQRLKGFGEGGDSGAVHRRIAALEPSGFTRVGAAIRHATACLAREDAHHRLLLVLSDGRPNDVDVYEGRYGIEDTRAAAMEAGLQGVTCFCLTVDREAPRYASRIFGRTHFAVVPRPDRIPEALTTVLRRLVRS